MNKSQELLSELDIEEAKDVGLNKFLDDFMFGALGVAFKGLSGLKITSKGSVYSVKGFTKSDLAVDAAFVLSLGGVDSPGINAVVGVADRNDNEFSMGGSYQILRSSNELGKKIRAKVGGDL